MQRLEIPQIPLRHLVQATLGIALVAGLFWLLIRFHTVVLLLVAAIILGTALRPGVRRLEQHGIPRQAGILLIYSLVALVAGLLIWYSTPVLARQGTAISESLTQGYTSVREQLLEAPNILVSRLASSLPEQPLEEDQEELPPVTNGTEEEPDTGLMEIWQQAGSILTVLLQIFAVFMLAFFWALEGERLKQAGFLLIPIQRREGVRALVNNIETMISGYVIGQGTLVLIIGVLAFLAYLLIGLPYAFLLAIIAGLLEAVPVIGPVLGAVPALIIAISISPVTALWVVIATVIIQQLENSLLVPRVMRRAVGVRPLVTLLALLAFGTLFGIWGALIALPVAAVGQMLLNRTLLEPNSLQAEERGRDHLSVLRYETAQLVQDVRNQVRDKESMPTESADLLEDEVETIAIDLESYLNEQEQGSIR